ncbi:MAG TPA: hypothetical protein DHW63_02455 [Hyphomonadaceae bacterium]|nr:hypothetical protein [Hyphomonadaceae bacterium]
MLRVLVFLFFALPSLAHAAIPATAARACGLTEAVLSASRAAAPVLARFDAEAAYADCGQGSIRIIEFADYSCPARRALHYQPCLLIANRAISEATGQPRGRERLPSSTGDLAASLGTDQLVLGHNMPSPLMRKTRAWPRSDKHMPGRSKSPLSILFRRDPLASARRLRSGREVIAHANAALEGLPELEPIIGCTLKPRKLSAHIR